MDPKEDASVEVIDSSSTSQTIEFSASGEGRYSISLQSKHDANIKDTISISVEYRDVQTFTEDQTVEVFLNYESFKSAGFVSKFPDFTQENMESAIRICIDQWIQNTGMNLNVRYVGLTENLSENGQIVVTGYAKHSSSDKTLGTGTLGKGKNSSNIRIYLTGVSENERDWSVFEVGGPYAFLALLIHEMGHSFGFTHNHRDAKLDTVMRPGYTGYNRYGPHIEDVKDAITVYGTREPFSLHLLRNGDDGVTWKDITNTTNLAALGIETSLPIGMNRDDDRFLLFYTDLKTHTIKNRIADIDGINWTTPSLIPYKVPYSKYGVSVNGYNNEYMVAWTSSNENRIEIWYSDDGGLNWTVRNPDYENDVSAAGGTPAIHKLATNTWILSYLKIQGNAFNKIVSRISIDDGKTWGEEIELFPDSKLQGIRGVSVTSNGTEKIRIAFSAAATESDPDFASRIVILNAHLDGTELIGDSIDYSKSVKSDNEPSITTSLNSFLVGYRDQKSDLKVRYGDKNGTEISGSTGIDNSWHKVPPTVVASKNRNRIFMLRME